MKQQNPKSRTKDLVMQELKDEVLLYDLKLNKAFCLNLPSAQIWQLCNGNYSVSDIRNELSQKLKKEITEDYVWLALDQLNSNNLLSNGSEIISDSNGLTRRAAIRKVGLATLMTLPIISSIVAPTAAHAQSGGACGGNLTSIDCGAATDDQFNGNCVSCLGSLPSCCLGQIVAAASCSTTAEGCSTCTRTCAYV